MAIKKVTVDDLKNIRGGENMKKIDKKWIKGNVEKVKAQKEAEPKTAAPSDPAPKQSY